MREIMNIWQLFLNLNEYVYATDIETNEIVYMNQKALDAYGLDSIDSIKEKKCYEVLQDASVNMAVGVIWEEKATKELDMLLQESERLMYADKERYYKEKGIQRRIY